MMIFIFSFLLFFSGSCYCAFQFTSSDFIKLVDDEDEIELTQDLKSSKIFILNNSLSRVAMNNVYIEIERERDDFEFKKYISLRDALKNGEKTIDLGMKLEKGDEIKLKYFGKEFLIGAMTAEDCFFEHIDDRHKPEFIKEYGSDGYFHNYSKYGGFLDWTFEDYHHVEIIEAGNDTMPNGQPLPGKVSTLMITVFLVLIMLGINSYLQKDKSVHC